MRRDSGGFAVPTRPWASDNSTMQRSLRLRAAARAVIRDSAGRILLVRFEFSKRVVWACPGGGLEPGETHEDAIRRELLEEVGLRVDSLGPCIWTRTHVLPMFDGRWDGQVERFFLVDTDEFEPRPMLTRAQLASEWVTDVRWWSARDLKSSSELFAPRALPDLIHRLARKVPSKPIDVGV